MPANTFPHRALALAALCGAIAGCTLAPNTAQRSAPVEAAPAAAACPPALAHGTRCLAGKDSRGAYYLIAVPEKWNGALVLHAHGGPALGEPSLKRAEEDLERWAIMVRAGYAWAGSTFRQGGVAASAAAEDTEHLRNIFREHVATPRRTILHGQSWGAAVAVRAAEMFGAGGGAAQPYDGVLLTSGVLGGGTHAYDVRTDLRVVYQYLCGNHPWPSEPQYALNLGLPAGAHMTPADISRRADECLGLDQPPAQRSAQQQTKVETITRVIRIPESAIKAHLTWGTLHFQDISSQRTGGASPFGNEGAVYTGSHDDAALNASVLRYAADPRAYRTLAADMDPKGKIPVPVLSVKWIDDPTAFVELDAYFRGVMQAGGSGDRLVQTFTRHGTHSYISDATYPTLMSALLRWVDQGEKPTAAAIARDCPRAAERFGGTCTFDPAYVPNALETRVPQRARPQ